MQGIALDDRLSKIYDAISPCNIVVDVGTDHGKLPANLIINDKCKKALLVDISSASLQKAINLFKKLNINSRAEFIVSDGLNNVNGNFNTLVIAGMGTPNIINILNNAINKLNSSQLILCSNTQISVLREYIYSIDYSITEEYIAEVSGKFYVIIKADAIKTEGSEKLYFKGKVNQFKDKVLVEKYLIYKRNKIQKSLKGYLSSKNVNQNQIDIFNKQLNWINEDLLNIKE
ncbi:MAG: SAM-dependent methyltransferase [Christensenellaceae bacterium]|nr:SAM-dependent methyltransferase [Christensenellaceae bacterium]